jgi:PAS domain S-box-containing protein
MALVTSNITAKQSTPMDIDSDKNLQFATLHWLQELTDQGILTTDANLCIRGWNRWLELHSGYCTADVLGHSLLEVYPELERRRLDRSYQQALNGQIVMLSQRLHRYLLPMPTTIPHANFTRMLQSAQIAPLVSDGKIIGTVTVIEDVTEREAREHELQRQITILEGLHEVSRAILSLDLPQYLQQLVETTATILRAPLVAVVLKRGKQLEIAASTNSSYTIDPSRINLDTNIAARAISKGQSSIYIGNLQSQEHVIALDPTSRSAMATPLMVENTVIGALVIESQQLHALNTDDQRQVVLLASQAAIGIHNAQLYQSAQDAIQVRDSFLSIASHELKTPLTSLLGSAHVLERRSRRDGSLNERDLRTLQVILRQANRLNDMVTSLLDSSRLQKGQLNIERLPFDLHDLIQRVVNEAESLFDRHHIELDLPDQPLMIEGDELRLEQVLQNLVQNAAKYSPHNDLIVIQVHTEADQVIIEVIDHGIGIPHEAQSMLFSQFFRAENAKTQHINGFGVGLYVVNEIVKQHNGTISVQSEENNGSTFRVQLPLMYELTAGNRSPS